jgi:hypothetical protein
VGQVGWSAPESRKAPGRANAEPSLPSGLFHPRAAIRPLIPRGPARAALRPDGASRRVRRFRRGKAPLRSVWRGIRDVRFFWLPLVTLSATRARGRSRCCRPLPGTSIRRSVSARTAVIQEDESRESVAGKQPPYAGLRPAARRDRIKSRKERQDSSLRQLSALASARGAGMEQESEVEVPHASE